MSRQILGLAVLLAALLPTLAAAAERYSFGVANQRTPTLTAAYWNPILAFVGKEAGIRLDLAMGKSADDTAAMVRDGEFDFLFANWIFLPGYAGPEYRVIARPAGPPIRGGIVVPEDSPITELTELAGREVGFPAPMALLGTKLPLQMLDTAKINVVPVFAGNQEGAMGQLRAGRVVAAAVNLEVMQLYAGRTGFAYRVLWSSEDHPNLPISAHPRVPAEVAERVRRALVAMSGDPEGREALKRGAAAIGAPADGFSFADDADYIICRAFLGAATAEK